ncbi:MAG: nucleotidyltransferase family protein [Chloroflexota bacterium]
MKTREDILAILTANKVELQRRFKVKRIALFGSYARGEQRSDSDVDILVEVDPSIGLDFVTLAETTEELLGLPAHIVSHRAMSSRNMKAIMADLVYV